MPDQMRTRRRSTPIRGASFLQTKRRFAPFPPAQPKAGRSARPATFRLRRRSPRPETLRLLLVGLLALSGLLWWTWPALQSMLARWLPTALLWLVLLGLLLLIAGVLIHLARRGPRQRRQQALRQLYTKRQTLRTLQSMDPLAFERYVGWLFEQAGYRVAYTARSGDEGIDLWLTRPDGQRLPAQCKRYADEHHIRSPQLQTFSGAMRKALAFEGYFVTTSTFTPAARAWAESEGIHLLDGPALLALAQWLAPETAEPNACAAPASAHRSRAIWTEGGGAAGQMKQQPPELP
jgi:HJR/Mrr/RecB family endonuclease